MRVSIAIEIADGDWPSGQALPDQCYPGPLAPFVAQVAAEYLRPPAAWAQERRARANAIDSYRGASPGKAAKIDRSA